MSKLIGLCVGLLLGYLYPLDIPPAMTLYMAVGLLAALDSALGGVRAQLTEEFHMGIFLSGALGNALIAVLLTWLGEKMGIPIYLCTVVVFGTRMFQNFGEIRRELLTSGQKRDRMRKDIDSSGTNDIK